MSDRITPFSEDAERAVLGAVLCHGASEQVLDAYTLAGISEESFFIPVHRMIYAAMLAVNKSGRPVDLVSLPDYLKQGGMIDEIGGKSFLETLVDQTPTASHAEHYAEIVLSDAMLRRMIHASNEVSNAAYDRGEDAEMLRGVAEAKFAGLKSERTATRTPNELLATQMQRWEAARETGCAGTPTGFRIFDRYFGGLMDAAYYVFSGEPGTGKTTLARNLAENLVMRGVPAAFFTLEQTAEQIWGAVAARHAKQSIFWLNMGSRNADIGKLVNSVGVVKDWPLYVDDTMHTPTTLWSACRRMVSKYGCKLIVLDYLQQLLPGKGKYGSQEERITDYSATCRQIAKTLHTPFIAISALSNQGQTRGSGMIGYDAWAHVRLTKSKDWNSGTLEVDVHFDKQRFGPPAQDEKLTLIGDEQRFEEEPICPDKPAPRDFQDTSE